MPISFLELVPKRPSGTVTIDSEQGLAEYEVTGVSLTQLVEIGKRYPAFGRTMDGGAAVGRFLAITEAMPALIAAGLGHPGNRDYEQAAARMPSQVVIALANKVLELTLPRPTQEEGEPEAPPAEEVVRDILPDRTSPLRLSS
ncbi:MAG TPA: hypothetical protein VNM46_11370 [Xanthobacteraceae bacterium]|jgi:hypothetical protein|nr:hypothetical protein [Xanthobacteraceae bacterium]